jgi:hypothetical protein
MKSHLLKVLDVAVTAVLIGALLVTLYGVITGLA